MPRGVYERKPRPRTRSTAAGGSVADLTEPREGGTIKVCIYPSFNEKEDKGEGGIKRVWEAQKKYLPKCGIEVVDSPDGADLIACHIEMPPTWLNLYPHLPIVGMCHGLYWSDYEWENWAKQANVKVMQLMRLADAITVPSEWVGNAVRRATSKPVEVIHHGIDVSEWEPGENKGFVLWNKTRPDPVCDPEPLTKVAELLPQVQFVSTYGKDAPNVTLTGRLPFDMGKKLIQSAGIYLCTAKETFGIGTLEAMAAGVPVVGYRWGGQVDIVREAYDGFLVPPGDVSSLALAIQGALTDREEMSAHARARAAEFSWEEAAEKYAVLFRRVVQKHREKRPRTSIIVTNYDLHEYLFDCLGSVANQVDQDWECIVVDDASPSKEGIDIARTFEQRDPRFKVIVNEKNVYLAEARNIGIRAAKGKYILPLDADDMIASTAVKVLADQLDTNRLIHVAYGKVQFVDEDGVTPTIYEGFEHTPGYSGWPFKFTFEQQVMQRNLLPYCSMFRREAWEYTGGYRPRCRTAEDADFWTRLASYGFTPEMVTDTTTLIYRNRPRSMSREQGEVDWIKWFPWARDAEVTPAGACTKEQMPVPSFDRSVVSVIIPVGPNHRVLVKDAIDSVDAQFFRDWDCIVVNDTGQPLDELPSWVHIIDTASTGQGVAAARNIGVRAAKTPLFLPLDADDYLQPNALGWMVQAYARYRDIIYSDFWEDPKEPGKFSVYTEKDFSSWQPTRGVLHAVTALTPKSAWEKVGGYDEGLYGWEDWDFQLKCADVGICSRRLASPVWVYRKFTGLRREDNVANFEKSKQGILSKWGKLYQGETLMACRSCSARNSIQPTSSKALAAGAMRSPSTNEEVVLVQYTGGKAGNMPFKGKSGTFYIFSANEQPKYVLKKDAVVFEGRQDFKILPRPEPEVVENSASPILVAEGKP